MPTYHVLVDKGAGVGVLHSAAACQRRLKDEMCRVLASVTIFRPQTQVSLGDAVTLQGHRIINTNA